MVVISSAIQKNNKEVTAKSSALGKSSPIKVPTAVNAEDCVIVFPTILLTIGFIKGTVPKIPGSL